MIIISGVLVSLNVSTDRLTCVPRTRYRVYLALFIDTFNLNFRHALFLVASLCCCLAKRISTNALVHYLTEQKNENKKHNSKETPNNVH